MQLKFFSTLFYLILAKFDTIFLKILQFLPCGFKKGRYIAGQIRINKAFLRRQKANIVISRCAGWFDILLGRV